MVTEIWEGPGNYDYILHISTSEPPKLSISSPLIRALTPVSVALKYELYAPFGWTQRWSAGGYRLVALMSERFTHESTLRQPIVMDLKTLDHPQLKTLVYAHLAKENDCLLLDGVARNATDRDTPRWDFHITEPGRARTYGSFQDPNRSFQHFLVAARAASATTSIVTSLTHQITTQVIKVSTSSTPPCSAPFVI